VGLGSAEISMAPSVDGMGAVDLGSGGCSWGAKEVRPSLRREGGNDWWVSAV